MNFCYLCGNELTPSNDHGEHIFQQGIGGTLAPHGILCKTCGKNLGSKIDVIPVIPCSNPSINNNSSA